MMFIKESLSHNSNNNFTFKNKLVNLIIIVFLIIPALSIGLITVQNDSIADQTVPAQTITSDVTWNTDNYIVEGDITIASNGNLTIQQGSNVLYKGNYTIYVEGILFINGTSASPVRLVPNIADPAPGFWGGIRINNTGSGSIVFAEIHYATYGLYLDQVQNYSIKSTEIHYSSISGLVCDGTNKTVITNNSFSENNMVGLHLISAENTTIKYNTINSNLIGINVSGSRNNLIGNNSISNRLRNTYDDDTSLTNNWVSNYYGDYMGVDTDNDFIGDFMNYGMSPGFNQDMFPKTKIFNDVDSNTYASLAKAIEGSTSSMIVIVPAKTPNAGSQTLKQTAFFFENLKIDSGVGHDVILSGQGSDLVTLDGNYGTCIEVNGNYKLLMNGFKIANSKKGLYLRNGANNCSISNSVMENNEIGALLENTRDITIRKCNFDNNYGLGSLLVNNSKRTTIINGYFNNSDYGIILTDSNFNLILNSSCILNTYAGLLLNYSSFNMINNSVFDSNLDYGVILENMSEYNSFSNNEYTNNYNGIYFNMSSNNHFWHSRLIANNRWGIYLNQQANENVFRGISSAYFQGSNIAIVMKNNSVNASFINSTVGSSNVLPLWIDHNSSIIFLNSVLNENTVAILDSLSTMTMMYYLTVITVNKTNVPIPNASVEVYDNKTELIAAGNTSEVGELPLIPCISYIRNQTLRDYSSNNHILIANDSISTKTAYVNISFTKFYVFKFNYIPSILTADNLTAIEKVFYSVKYEALSLEPEKNVTWSLKTNTSSWLQLDAANGTIFGTPHNRDVGEPWVRVIAMDMDGDTAENLFTLTIQNTAPEIITTNQLSVFEDDYYYVDYNSTDDDGYFNETGVLIFPEDNLTTWQGKPNAEWLDFDNESGILNGTPNNNHVGRYNVQIFVDDGHGGTSSSTFTLTVVNTPPKIISPDVTSAYKNVNYYNDYNSSDDGQGVITWKMETNTNRNITWLFLNEQNGTLNGTPRQANVGTWWVNITVLDDYGGETSHNFTLTVIDLNEPPKIITENVLTAYTNKLYSVQYEGDDPDTPLYNLSWAVNTNATWLEIDPETGVLFGTPQKWHVGWYWVNVSVMDNEGGAGFTEFIINVTLLPNTPPSLVELSLIPDNEATIEAFFTWKHTFKAEDDYTPANELNWSLATNAVWLTINKSSGQVQGRPEPQDIGRHWVNVTVLDEEGLFNYTNFTLVVKHTNQAPKLKNGGMTPSNGTEDDWFTFYVTYTDADNDSGKVWVWIDNRSYPMNPEPGSNLRFSEGVNYTYRIKLDPGKHTYYFEARDAWDLEAKTGSDVPSKDTPASTNKIKEVVVVPFYYQPMCWIVGIIILIILLLVLQIVLKPMSKSYPKLEFVNRITIPDRINPIIQYNLRREHEALGELGFLCPKCKSVLSEDATECENCGEIFTVTEYQCPNCTAEVDSSDLFCPKCGSKFEELEEEEEEPVVDDEPDIEKEPEEVEVDDKEPPETLEAISEVDKDVDKQDKKLAVKAEQLPKSLTKALPAGKVASDEKKEVKKAKRVVEESNDDPPEDNNESDEKQDKLDS